MNTVERDKCVDPECAGIYLQTGIILGLAFRHPKDRVVSKVKMEAWDILCRPCMSHQLWGHTLYYNSPEVHVVTPCEEDIRYWGDERVISCGYCGSILLDDGEVTALSDDPESVSRGWINLKEDD